MGDNLVCLDFASLYPRITINIEPMGTNYYLKKILTKEEQMRLGYRVMNVDQGPTTKLEDLKHIIREMESFLNPRHLGKLSAGWEFCFRANPDLYADNWDAIYNYLEKEVAGGKAVIISEYGDEVPPEKFKEKIFSHKGMQNFEHNNEEKIPESIWRPVKDTTREWLSDVDKTWWYDGEFS